MLNLGRRRAAGSPDPVGNGGSSLRWSVLPPAPGFRTRSGSADSPKVADAGAGDPDVPTASAPHARPPAPRPGAGRARRCHVDGPCGVRRPGEPRGLAGEGPAVRPLGVAAPGGGRDG